MVIDCTTIKKGTYPVMARIHCRQYVGNSSQRRCVLHARAHIKVMEWTCLSLVASTVGVDAVGHPLEFVISHLFFS